MVFNPLPHKSTPFIDVYACIVCIANVQIVVFQGMYS